MISGSCALFGHTGYVGGWLSKTRVFDECFNSCTLQEARDKVFDTVFISCLPALKYHANLHPEEDLKVINDIIKLLSTVTAERCVLVSTIDVYGSHQRHADENTIPEPENTYGKHRLKFENFCREQFKICHVLRLPALFGRGLRKNLLFDLLHERDIQQNLKSTYQWYNLEWLSIDVAEVINEGREVKHLLTSPMNVKSVLAMFPHRMCEDTSEKIVTYDFKSDGGYTRCPKQVEESMRKFIGEYVGGGGTSRRRVGIPAVSNICCEHLSRRQFNAVLRHFGVPNVELAPTKFATWNEILNGDGLSRFVSACAEDHLVVQSLHSIAFGICGNIFDDADNALGEHLARLSKRAKKNGIRVLVFGCPRNRVKGDKSPIDAVPFFRRLSERLHTTLCIENNASGYSCDFLNTPQEVEDFVTAVDRENIKSMLDVGNAKMEQATNYGSNHAHYHISEPYLGAPPTSSRGESCIIPPEVGVNDIVTLEFLVRCENATTELQTLVDALEWFMNGWRTAPSNVA